MSQSSDRPEPPSPSPSATPAGPNAWQSTVRFMREMMQYYAANRGELWQYAIEVTPFLERTGDRAREIRIAKDDAIGADAFDGQNWRLTFPDCCVVTGERADGPWIEEEETLPNLAWPFWGTVAGFFGGLVLSLIIKIWLWPIFLLMGMAIGFANRQTRTVALKFRKSKAAAGDDEFPQAWLLPEGLLVRLGSSIAKKAFVQHRVDRQEANRSGAVAIAPRRDAETLKMDTDEEPKSPTAPPPPSQGRQDLPPISLDDE